MGVSDIKLQSKGSKKAFGGQFHVAKLWLRPKIKYQVWTESPQLVNFMMH